MERESQIPTASWNTKKVRVTWKKKTDLESWPIFKNYAKTRLFTHISSKYWRKKNRIPSSHKRAASFQRTSQQMKFSAYTNAFTALQRRRISLGRFLCLKLFKVFQWNSSKYVKGYTKKAKTELFVTGLSSLLMKTKFRKRRQSSHLKSLIDWLTIKLSKTSSEC